MLFRVTKNICCMHFLNNPFSSALYCRHRILLLLFAFFCYVNPGFAQLPAQTLAVELSGLDGIELNTGNIFNYRIDNRSARAQPVTVIGRVQFRRSQLGFNYRFTTVLQPGTNNIRDKATAVSWNYNDPALRELFERYHKLPQGTYEYCVTVQSGSGDASRNNEPDACVYYTVDDAFLINLVSPENDAKLHEQYPLLNWVVNYPFASELTYRVRVAELKKGQNNAAAIQRNNPVFEDKHVMTSSTVYPVTAKPLEKWQPYVWTVDAYYKGILLGGAEVWKFTIVDDSLYQPALQDPAYVDIRRESGSFNLYAPGLLRIKYELKETMTDTLQLELQDDKGISMKVFQPTLTARYGDNRFTLDFYERQRLRHKKMYTLLLYSQTGKTYRLAFKYVNPELIK
jgi:hypothetical protein